MNYRQEKDSIGIINVPEDALWGAQTQRSFENFPQDVELMPLSQIKAQVMLKKACAIANHKKNLLDKERMEMIVMACDEILEGKHDKEFPLTVWQTGSGTQTNMNTNEVITHIVNNKLGESLIHPNDHVNMSQSSNDTFPTSMHVSTAINLNEKLYPAIEKIIGQLKLLEKENDDIIKTGRTHLQDATPVKLSQEISAWRVMIERDYSMIKDAEKHLHKLAIGGTAVGTGINTPEGFGDKVAEELKQLTDIDFVSDENKFYQLSSKSALVIVHSAIKTLATDLYKIASDIRFSSCGPRCGISELVIPSNEPGSSIMPGKVNPTQVESITMICIQVMANDFAISMANTQGQMQLNVYMPLIIYNMDQSINLLSKSIICFTDKLLKGLKADKSNIDKNLNNSLMLVTKLSPHIGYDKASEIAKNAYNKNLTLKESTLELGYLSEEEFDKYMKVDQMV
ncbi:lyase family protein [uncultured Anaerococcus sp.]|uniref:class II fumarate hydratase n=1 Tax=uncultured Anaerococcus sp. TaxID=293428 RepID=UPI002624297A|nr:class II fumarate hydratase [uncultured Anaerococcus sp.]